MVHGIAIILGGNMLVKRHSDHRKKAAIILVPCLCFGLTSCQQSPDSDYVVNKNENVFESIVAEENTENQQVDVPENFQDSFVIDDEIKVTVDAQVKAEYTSMPVANATPHMITEDDVRLWADVFFEGKTAYEPKVEMTKSEIEETILRYKTKIEEAQNSEDEELRNMVDLYQKELSSYESIYASASEDVEPIVCDFTFHSYDYFMTAADRQFWDGNSEYESLKYTQQIQANVEDLNGLDATLTATRRSESDYMMNLLDFYYIDSQNLDDMPYKEMTQEEAAELADQALEKLGLSDWVIASCSDMSDSTTSRFILNYTMTCQGIPLLSGYNIDLKSEDAYAANYYYSSLEVMVRNGIIESVFLISPMDITSIENENVKVKSFDEVYDLFKSQMENSFTIDSIIDFGEDTQMKNAPKEIRITDIELGMFRVSKKDAEYEYMLVPVWAFSGTIYVNGEDWGTSNFCMLNAVDGSTINVSLGY